MASYIPKGWKMSPAGAVRFSQPDVQKDVDAVISARMRKYSKGLRGYGPEDLRQESMLAAAYAVDTYNGDRGNFKGYIGTVVGNALAMVAAEALAQCRQSHVQVQNQDGSWSKVPVSDAELMDVHIDNKRTAEQSLIAVEDRCANDKRAARARDLIGSMGMSDDANTVLKLRNHPPPELWVKARNLNRGQYRLNSALMAEHLGWPLARYNRAITELNARLRQYNVEAVA